MNRELQKLWVTSRELGVELSAWWRKGEMTDIKKGSFSSVEGGNIHTHLLPVPPGGNDLLRCIYHYLLEKEVSYLCVEEGYYIYYPIKDFRSLLRLSESEILKWKQRLVRIVDLLALTNRRIYLQKMEEWGFSIQYYPYLSDGEFDR